MRRVAATGIGLALVAMSGCGLLKPPRYCCVAASDTHRPCQNSIDRRHKAAPKAPKVQVACPLEMSIGPSAGALVESPAGHVGLDVTVARGHTFAWWASLGSRLEISSKARGLRGTTYLEGGARLAVLLLGAGAAIRYDAHSAQAGPQLFVGFAWPLTSNHRWYFAPYYRPAFLFDLADRRFGMAHEIGVLFKFATSRAHYAECGD